MRIKAMNEACRHSAPDRALVVVRALATRLPPPSAADSPYTYDPPLDMQGELYGGAGDAQRDTPSTGATDATSEAAAIGTGGDGDVPVGGEGCGEGLIGSGFIILASDLESLAAEMRGTFLGSGLFHPPPAAALTAGGWLREGLPRGAYSQQTERERQAIRRSEQVWRTCVHRNGVAV